MVGRCKGLATVWTGHAEGPQEWLCPAVGGESAWEGRGCLALQPRTQCSPLPWRNTEFRIRGPGTLSKFLGDLELWDLAYNVG